MIESMTLPEQVAFFECDWLSCNLILLHDEDGATLIDTGHVKYADRNVERVRAALAGRPLRRIVNTHLHSDHCGGNVAMREAFGCEIFVPAADLASVEQWDTGALNFAATGQRCPRFAADGVIAPGDVLACGGGYWDVLASPGHDPHSLILHDAPRRLLISADALWQNGFGIIFPELSGQSGFDEQQSVLELIASLPVEQVLPGHGPVFADPRRALADAFGRLAAMRSDPRRHARSAIKVLIKFLLIDHECMALAELTALAGSAWVFADTARLLGGDPVAVLQAGIEQLAGQGLARIADGWVYDAPARKGQ